MRLSEIIKEYATKRGITYRQLARELNTSHTQVFLMLDNESIPKVETLKKMSEIMKIPMDELKAAAYKEIDGEIKAFLTEEEIANRGIIRRKGSKAKKTNKK